MTALKMMREKMPKIDIQQSTPEWHAWRKGKLSASKSSIILGLSIYQTPFELWEEVLGLSDPKPSSAHMQRGLDVEDEARQWLWERLGMEFKPTCWEHVNPVYISSLDGMNSTHSCIVEIKNNNVGYHEMARSGNIVPMHLCQMQHSMFVTDLEFCSYLSWRKGDPILKQVMRDQPFIDYMIPKLLDFKRMCDDLEPPPLTDRDYVDMSDDIRLFALSCDYENKNSLMKALEKTCKNLKEEIKEKIGNRNAKCKQFKLTKYPTRAIIDYDKLIADHCPNVDLKPYTKPTTYAYRITMEN